MADVSDLITPEYVLALSLSILSPFNNVPSVTTVAEK